MRCSGIGRRLGDSGSSDKSMRYFAEITGSRELEFATVLFSDGGDGERRSQRAEVRAGQNRGELVAHQRVPTGIGHL